MTPGASAAENGPTPGSVLPVLSIKPPVTAGSPHAYRGVHTSQQISPFVERDSRMPALQPRPWPVGD